MATDDRKADTHEGGIHSIEEGPHATGYCWRHRCFHEGMSFNGKREELKVWMDLSGRKRDLVEWLREEEQGNPGTDVSSGLLGLAADEIERLREQ